MGNVADQPDGQAFDAALDAADREHIEQALSRVLVSTTPCIDDRSL
jgi:hypothetical protein